MKGFLEYTKTIFIDTKLNLVEVIIILFIVSILS